MNLAYRLVMIMIMLGLASCDSERASRSMVNYVKEIEARPPGKVEPVPEPPAYKAFTFKDEGLRSPFSAPVRTTKERADATRNGPDLTRVREPLERFPLDALSMVGTLSKNGKTWAILRDKEGTVHHVTVGNYIGQNYGKITSITNDQLIIIEKIPDEGDNWRDHEAVLKMKAE